MADETLAAGDLTTAFSKWLASNATLSATAPKDKNVAIRNLLAVDYSRTQPADLSSMLARFLKDRT